MTLDQVVVWIIVGGVAGLIAEALVKGVRVGLIGTIAIGILGALIGGWLFRQFNITLAAGLLGEIIVAVIGSVVLLVVLRVVRRI
jgi:uncharacterized membrane protein YeaQ/YmgE (transglycosylase-associated protein family)